MFLFFNFFLIACTNSERKKEKHPVEIVAAVKDQIDSFGISEVITSVTCDRNPVLSYSLYLPHQNGVTFDETNRIVQGLLAEVSGRLNADVKQISLAGFSGGAKVALVAASQSSSLLSIIYCGAGLPQIPQQLSKILFTGSVSGQWKIKYNSWMKV